MANDTGVPVFDTLHWPFDNSYKRLPERFYARLPPTPVRAPRLIKLNEALARELGLDPSHLTGQATVEMLAGNRIAEGSEPIALAYAGHQFGNFVPQLGDGRAILLGEIVDTKGVRRDIQLKGSGPTPFSRRGDGRAALGPVLREYIVSEAMYALGIPTTRSLAAVLTGEDVFRETALPGAVLTRVASSHIRVGTFQYFAARQDLDALRLLADHVIARHYAEVSPGDYRALLEAVMTRQASLVARWMLVGFIHGVMNTDNTSIAGETIDYGPCAFMDTYHPNTVFSSIDQGGRYAYANQGRIAVWNLARFAETLMPLLSEDDDQALAQANESLQKFSGLFADAWFSGLRRKLGLADAQPEDEKLAQDLLNAMAANSADFTQTFRKLCDAAADPDADGAVRDQFLDPAAYDSWAVRWRQRLAGDPAARRAAMRAVNPAYIPRNHRVEAALSAAVDGDFQPFEELLLVLSRPFEERPEYAGYADPPLEEQRVLRTFCGT
jgi:serine/tyrosine/threonine adenylyltransferase